MDLSYLNKNGKKVTGAAAFTHYVYNVKGGEDEYNKFIGEIYIKEFVNQQSININKAVERDAKKNRFKVV